MVRGKAGPGETFTAYMFLAPFLIVFAIFLVYPIFYSLLLSFEEMGSGYDLSSLRFVWFKNYVELARDPEFWWALLVTIYYAVLVIPGGIFASLFLAILLSNKLKGTNFFRSAYFLPNVLDMLVIGIIWTLIYSKGGIVDVFLNWVARIVTTDTVGTIMLNFPLFLFALLLKGIFYGFGFFLAWLVFRITSLRERMAGMPVLGYVLDFTIAGAVLAILYSKGGLFDLFGRIFGIALETGLLGNPYTVMPAVVFALVVKGAGFGMVLFLAAIQNIPESVYEAADIDGAGPLDKFFHITLPLVKPIILFMIITGTIGALNAFTEIYAMTKGGPVTTIAGIPLGATKLTGYYLFTKWEYCQYGYAAAVSYVLLGITMLITMINVKFIQTEEA